MAFGLLLASVVGLSLGLLGGGGSALSVPIFVYVLGYGAKEAIAMSLAVVAVTSLFAGLGHWRRGNVSFRVAAVFGPVAMLGAYAGARAAALVSGSFQLGLFAVVTLTSAAFMLRGSSARAAEPPARPAPLPLIVPEALVVGLVTGLVGVGGGFLVVPALMLLGRVPVRVAIGTSLIVIAMNATAGFVGYLGRVELPWSFMAGFAAVATAGALGGALVCRFVPQHVLRRSFAALLLVMGALILYENRMALVRGYGSDVTPAHSAALLGRPAR